MLNGSGWVEIMEICICAAWKGENGKVYRGHRHVHCIDAMDDAGTKPAKGGLNQGFITSLNRFVDRFDGYRLQEDAGIKSVASGGYRNRRLFSEDLY